MSLKEKETSQKEVMLMSKVKHQNIVSFIRSFQDRDSVFIVMEFCDGGDLMEKIRTRRGVFFTEEQVLSWFVQVCLGLKHIHNMKILHRDVKPENIFLTDGGTTAKLGDFGIARMLNNSVDLARTRVGTPYYLSPEICESQPYNNKTDIWSLGCVLYELCSLRHPFQGNSLRQLVAQICCGSYRPAPTHYSAHLHLLLSHLFKVNPRDRPSISSVLRRPFLEKHIRKHVDHQESSQLKLQKNKPPEKAAAGRAAEGGAERPGAPEGRGPTPPGSQVATPPGSQRPPGRGGGEPPAGNSSLQLVRTSRNHRNHRNYRNYHQQLDALQSRRNENLEAPPPPPAAPVEPFQLVAASRDEFLQRRWEAERHKLRAERQLGLRPSTAECSSPERGRLQGRRQEEQEEVEQEEEEQEVEQEEVEDHQLVTTATVDSPSC